MIEINGVKIRELSLKDKDILYEMINDETINKFTVETPLNITYEQHCEWFNKLHLEKDKKRFMIMHNNETIGTIILSHIDYNKLELSLGIKILKNRGNGIGTKAIKIMVDYIFNEMNMNRIYASILDYNIASQKIFVKNGFVQEGVKEQGAVKYGQKYDLLIFSLLKDDYIINNKLNVI